MIDLKTITQLERGTIDIPWEFPENLSVPSSVLGAVITGIIDNRTTGEAYTITGTLTGTAAELAKWALSETDSGTPGTLHIILKAVVSGVATYTLAAQLIVQPHPSASIVPAAPLVAIPQTDADWLAAAALGGNLGTAAYADTGDFEVALGNPGTNGYLLSSTTLGARTWIAPAAGASDVDDLTTTTGTATYIPRVAAAGGLEYRTPAQVLGDIGAVATASLSAAPTASEPLKANGNGGLLFGGKVSAGISPTADDTMFNVRRSITGAINSHAYRDESTHTPGAGSTGYASYDVEFSMSGGQSYDHFAGFQSRPIFAGSGTITKHVGFWSLPTHTGTGTLTSLQHFRVMDTIPSGGGAITTQYGLYVDELTGGATDWAVFTAGATPSFFGGLLQAGSNFRVDGLASFGGVAANTAYQVYIPSNLDATKTAALAALAVAPINLNTGSTYGLFFSNTAQNNTLAAIGTNFVYGMSGMAGVIATGANSAARATYGGRFQSYYQANSPYTATAIYAFAIHVDTIGTVGAGTIAFGETVGINIENQSTSKSPTSHGLRIVNQTGSTTAYSIWTGTGIVRLMGADSDKIAFHGVTPVARQLLATGAGATVDNVITALQTLGLLRQS